MLKCQSLFTSCLTFSHRVFSTHHKGEKVHNPERVIFCITSSKEGYFRPTVVSI